MTTAITPRGRELERFEKARLRARAQVLTTDELVHEAYSGGELDLSKTTAAHDEYEYRHAGVPDE